MSCSCHDHSVKQINTENIKPAKKRSQWRQRLWEWYHFEMPYIFPQWMRESYDAIRFWLFPRNRWAVKYVPNHWSDKTELIPEFLYAAIIDFVECEHALETIVWDEKEEAKIKEVYHWAKYVRHEMQEQIDGAYPETSMEDLFNPNSDYAKKSFHDLYGEVNRLESEYQKIETEYLTWMIQNREKLCT